ncbi:hypothetical protein CPB86DRAFT_783106 [Serendipita vermifera]|nr:hypothetical protein CPB86DRAFT_783106 [Serendipita vermifera]
MQRCQTPAFCLGLANRALGHFTAQNTGRGRIDNETRHNVLTGGVRNGEVILSDRFLARNYSRHTIVLVFVWIKRRKQKLGKGRKRDALGGAPRCRWLEVKR